MNYLFCFDHPDALPGGTAILNFQCAVESLPDFQMSAHLFGRRAFELIRQLFQYLSLERVLTTDFGHFAVAGTDAGRRSISKNMAQERKVAALNLSGQKQTGMLLQTAFSRHSLAHSRIALGIFG
jgi:hypothetical protein